MKNVYIIILLTLFIGCSTREPLPPNPLYNQILKVRNGHDGLTNSYCEKYKGNKCESLKIVTYSLKDPKMRYRLGVELGFICYIAGKRYKVCYDKEGFCRFTYERSNLVFKKLVEKYIPLHPLEYHIQANTKCYSNKRI